MVEIDMAKWVPGGITVEVDLGKWNLRKSVATVQGQQDGLERRAALRGAGRLGAQEGSAAKQSLSPPVNHQPHATCPCVPAAGYVGRPFPPSTKHARRGGTTASTQMCKPCWRVSKGGDCPLSLPSLPLSLPSLPLSLSLSFSFYFAAVAAVWIAVPGSWFGPRRQLSRGASPRSPHPLNL